MTVLRAIAVDCANEVFFQGRLEPSEPPRSKFATMARPFGNRKLGHFALRVRHWKQWLHERWYLGHCIARTVGGITVRVIPYDLGPRDGSTPLTGRYTVDQGFAAIGEAFSLLDRHAPQILAGMRRRRMRLGVTPSLRPSYWVLSNTIQLPPALVIGIWPAVTASSIVHEWTHARVSAARAYALFTNEIEMPREEALCAKEEIDFIKRLSSKEFPFKDELIADIREAYEGGYWRLAERQRTAQQWWDEHYGDSSTSPR